MSEPKPLLAPLRAASIAPRLWKDGGFIDDAWRTIADDEALPTAGRAIVSLGRWRAEQPTLTTSGLKIGVRLQPGEALAPASDHLDRLGVIALAFPKFTDGRAYSTARHLREQLGFEGELRATGDVLLDQLPLMQRTGFDAFEITNAATASALDTGRIPAVPLVYQRSVGRDTFGWRARRAGQERLTAAE